MLLTDEQKIRRLPWSLAHVAANTVFVQLVFMGPVFVLFLTELGLTKAQVGLLLAIFPVAGIIAPFVAPVIARLGYKRVYVTIWGIRKFVIALLLLTPTVASRAGPSGTLRFVAAVLTTFALLRAVAETAQLTWTREYVPDRVRGRLVSLENLTFTIFGFGAISLAGYTIERISGLDGFMRLIAIGIVFGLIGVVFATQIPGGAPLPPGQIVGLDAAAVLASARDRDYARFLGGLGLIGLGTVALNSFLPLFAREQIGLSQANVIWLQNASLIGGLISGYLWGMASDRVGSKPVMLAGVVVNASLPLLWLSVPHNSAWGFPSAMIMAFIAGVGGPAWSIGSIRFLFIDIMPPHETPRYMAAYYAWTGVTGAIGAIYAGNVLQNAQEVAARVLHRDLNPYTLLFLVSSGLMVISLALLTPIRSRAQAISNTK